MIATLLATVLASTPVLSDTVVRLGIVERDLTGDNVPEILSLTGRGQTVDSLEVTFTITSSGRTVFETKWSETRAVGSDAGRRVLSAAEHRRRLRQLGRFFFADEKFMSPAEFLISLRGSAPGQDRKSTRLNSSHLVISYAVFCLNKQKEYEGRDGLRGGGEQHLHIRGPLLTAHDLAGSPRTPCASLFALAGDILPAFRDR